MKSLAVAAIATSAMAGVAAADATVVFLPQGFLITDLSYDASAGVGNVQGDGTFETFRWTIDGGVERLGRASVPAIGAGGGSPDISYDGTRISASILSSDNKLTQGLWDIATGWTETMPPPPPGGIVLDLEYGSAWGLSGDGSTLTGYYRGPNSRAWASAWTAATGVTHLGQTLGRSARVDAASYDGSVTCGWEESATGPWLATAWRNGVKHTLADGDGGGGGGARDLSANGDIIVGSEYSESQFLRVATVWTWNGASYDMQNIGALPGTIATSGQAYFAAVSEDGSMAVGSNLYTLNPGGSRAGIVWTPEGGLMSVTDFFSSIGVTDQIPATFDVREISAVSPDGSAIACIALDSATVAFHSFIVYLPVEPTDCPGDTNGDNVVDFADFSTVLNQYGQTGAGLSGDVNGDGVVDFTDFSEVLANYGIDCN